MSQKYFHEFIIPFILILGIHVFKRGYFVNGYDLLSTEKFTFYMNTLEIYFLFLFQVDHHRKDLLNYIIFLRITPFLPNWFINITSPVLNVSLWSFFLGTFIGMFFILFNQFISRNIVYNLKSYSSHLEL